MASLTVKARKVFKGKKSGPMTPSKPTTASKPASDIQTSTKVY